MFTKKLTGYFYALHTPQLYIHTYGAISNGGPHKSDTYTMAIDLRPSRSPRAISGWSIIICAFTGCICFYGGVLWGIQAGIIEGLKQCDRHNDCDSTNAAFTEKEGMKGNVCVLGSGRINKQQRTHSISSIQKF
jgi:hypothetical protein